MLIILVNNDYKNILFTLNLSNYKTALNKFRKTHLIIDICYDCIDIIYSNINLQSDIPALAKYITYNYLTNLY